MIDAIDRFFLSGQPNEARPGSRLRSQGADLTLTSIRLSQALVIELVDRTLGPRRGFSRTAVGRGTRWPADRVRALIYEPADLIDDTYDLAEALLSLHRNFAQRLLEAMDASDPGRSHPRETVARMADVIPLVRRKRG